MDPAFLFTLILGAMMLLVIAFDAWSYVIPNTLNLFILGVYPFAAHFLGLPWMAAGLAAAIVLVIGMGIFALGLMGGGDIKLLAILCLWTGWHIATPHFILLTALLGGALVVVILLLRFLLPPVFHAFRPGQPMPRLFVAKQPIPYGLAIAGAFLLMLWTRQVPGLSW